MVINSSGTMADCCLIMHQDIISLSGTIMLHYVSPLHHIKKLRILPTRAFVSWAFQPKYQCTKSTEPASKSDSGGEG